MLPEEIVHQDGELVELVAMNQMSGILKPDDLDVGLVGGFLPNELWSTRPGKERALHSCGGSALLLYRLHDLLRIAHHHRVLPLALV